MENKIEEEIIKKRRFFFSFCLTSENRWGNKTILSFRSDTVTFWGLFFVWGMRRRKKKGEDVALLL